jgi:hypothetical protein
MAELTDKLRGYIAQRIKGLDPSPAFKASPYKSNVMSDKAISVNAAKLEKKASVILALADAREKVANNAGLTLKSHLKRLEELSKASEQAEQFSAAITAETNRGKAAGLYVEKIDLNNKVSITINSDDSKCL